MSTFEEILLSRLADAETLLHEERFGRARKSIGIARGTCENRREPDSRWVSVAGNRCLAAALDAHLTALDSGGGGGDAPLLLLEAFDASLEGSAPEPAPRQTSAFSLDLFPIERCATIAASVAMKKRDKTEIFREHELEASTWEIVEQHWASELASDTHRGQIARLNAYDDAYVAQLEVERGPITVEEYAKLVVGSERGTSLQTLSELELPKGALPRLQRVWLRRASADRALARELRRAIATCAE